MIFTFFFFIFHSLVQFDWLVGNHSCTGKAANPAGLSCQILRTPSLSKTNSGAIKQ